VQLTDTNEDDELSFGLTSEGDLNDALAFWFVYFGIYILKDSNWHNWLGKYPVLCVVYIASGIVMELIVP
jgi:NhaP-type Na+/H+ or K+/H+ antiporter